MTGRFAAVLAAQSRQTLRQLQTPVGRRAWNAELAAIRSALARAPWLLHAGLFRELSIVRCVEHWARTRPYSIAISDERESLDWLTFAAGIRSWSEALTELGVQPGSRVTIVAENSAKLVIALFAIQASGGVVQLIDPRGGRDAQVATLRQFRTNWLVYDALEDGEELAPALRCPAIGFDELALRSQRYSGTSDAKRRHLVREPFVVLSTSGTTGEPKPVFVSNLRSVLSGFGIAGFCLSLTRHDAVHCVLPLSHATALMTALCPALVAGCRLVLRRRFVPNEFWADVVEQQSTHLLYVGELVRALLSAPAKTKENEHGLRMAYGNGMTLDVWHRFQARFRIHKVLEYYGATELPLALVNLAGEPGFVGRTPLAELSPWRVVARDADSGALTRDGNGLCVNCPAMQAGELVLMSGIFAGNFGKPQVSEARQHMQLISDVVLQGDCGLRTGDIVRRDSHGYVKFEDRTFEVFRQQGHNVSASRVTKVIRSLLGVADAGVTHIVLPRYDGQLALAVIVPNDDFNLNDLALKLESLAPFERPRFLRLTKSLRLNRSLKFDHAHYRREGINPASATEPTFIYRKTTFDPISPEIWAALELGQVRF